jgi:hypothetical protein
MDRSLPPSRAIGRRHRRFDAINPAKKIYRGQNNEVHHSINSGGLRIAGMLWVPNIHVVRTYCKFIVGGRALLNDSPHSISVLAHRFVGTDSPIPAAQSRRAPPSALGVPDRTPETADLFVRQVALVTCIEVVVRLAQSVVPCPASDRGGVAGTAIS